MSKLVIVESPAKCSKIQGFLGPDFQVIASMGHIRSLEEGIEAIGLDRDFEPRYAFLVKEKSKAINALKAAAAGKKEIFLAADDDREGEAIAYSVAVLLKLPIATTKRAVFHEITKPAVCKAVAQPRTIDMNRVNAQQARAMLDMMIGFTISPLLWKHVARGLSAGRCQTPALRFVVERENEIAGHSAQTSWIVKGVWSHGKSKFSATLKDELEDEESAVNYLEIRQESTEGTIKSVTVKPWTEKPPEPLITSTLQQAASSMYHCNPKNTMKIAQRLYEAGHITYMRTDKAVLCEEAIEEAKVLITKKYGADYVGSSAAAAPKKSAKKPTGGAGGPSEEEPKAQEAHEAIRPTHFEIDSLPPEHEYPWSSLDQNIYRLIRARAIQSVMAPARGETVSAVFQATGDEENDLEWSAVGRRTLFQGWRAIGIKPVNDDESTDSETDEEDAFTIINALKPGAKLQWTSLESQPHITKAAPRYTEATLVKALEQKGIGRPSTFASLLDAIIEKKYVEKKNIEGTKVTLNKYSIAAPSESIKKTPFQRALGAEKDRLVPTELGRQMLAFALKHFDDLFDFGFTAGLENRLDQIAAGNEPWKNILKNTWSSYKERYETLSKATGTSVSPSKDFVKDLGDGLKAQVTKKGPLLIKEGTTKATFYGWPTGVLFADMTPEIAKAFIQKSNDSIPTIGDYDGHPITQHKGQYGVYVKWNNINVSVKAEDDLTAIIQKIKDKVKPVSTGGGAGSDVAVVPAPLGQTVGPFTFKTGPYGPYMYKTDLKTKKFVSVPPGTDPSKLTIREADEIYKKGLEDKAEKAKKGAKFAAIKAAKGF